MYWACCVCISFYKPLLATPHGNGVDCQQLGPIESTKPLKMWRDTTCRHLVQRVLFASVVASSWWPDKIWLGPILIHVIIQIHTYVTESGSPELSSAYCNCIAFYLPAVARSHFIATDFLLNGPHRIFQPSEDVTENLVSAVYIVQLYQFLAFYSGQISFDERDCPGNWFHGRYWEFVNMSREHVSTMYLFVFTGRISSDCNCFLWSWVIQANGPGLGNAYLCKRFQIVPSMTM